MLLAVSVGNSSIRLGLFEGQGLRVAWRSPLEVSALESLWRQQIGVAFAGTISAAILSGVNPPAETEVSSWLARALGAPPAQVQGADIPVVNRCGPSVGKDRLLNAYAAHRLYSQDAVVVDFGTAMSFSVVSAGGEFLGGAIAPGLAMAARALHEQTAALPLVTPERFESAIGVSTEHAINSGLVGLAGMLDRILERLLAERKGFVRVLGTGGDLEWFLPLSRHPIESHPHLTLQGLMFLHSRLSHHA